jgi:hypothetical protein
MSLPDTARSADWWASAAIPWILRTGLAMCYIGHGAFGIITKQAWLPYFAVVGINERWAWELMPWIGAMDVTMGFLVFVWPCRALFAWAAAWTLWTALLRPLAGEGWPEFFERAGNYGVPIAMLVVVGLQAPWFTRLPAQWPALAHNVRHRLAWTLRLTTAILLAGHAACGVILQKPTLAHHYAAFWPDNAGRMMLGVGYFEFLLVFVVLAIPLPAVLAAVCVWKLATESLFLLSGAPAPVFEVTERGGSYAAPLALALLIWIDSARRRDEASKPPVCFGMQDGARGDQVLPS